MSTLGTLVDKVQIELQESTANYFAEASIKQAIGDAYQFYSLHMINAGQGWFVTTSNLAITASQETVSLTSLSPSFVNLVELEKNTVTGTVPLQPNINRYKYKSNLSVGAADSYIPEYYLRGTNIVLVPAPSSSESASSTTGLKLHYSYIPTTPTSASADGFEFDSNFNTMFEPMIVLWATITLLEQKDGMGAVSDMSSFRGRLEKWEEIFYNSLERDETPDEVQYSGWLYDY